MKEFFFKTELKKNMSVIRLYFYASNAQKSFTTCPPISFSHNIMTKSTEKNLGLKLLCRSYHRRPNSVCCLIE